MYTLSSLETNNVYNIDSGKITINCPFYIVTLYSDGDIIQNDTKYIDIMRVNSYSEYNNYSRLKFNSDNTFEYYLTRVSSTLTIEITNDNNLIISKGDNYTFSSFVNSYSPIHYNVSSDGNFVAGVFDLTTKTSYKTFDGSDYTGLYGNLNASPIYDVYSEPQEDIKMLLRNDTDFISISLSTKSSSPVFKNENYDIYSNFILVNKLNPYTGAIIDSYIHTIDVRMIDAINSLLPSSFRVLSFYQNITDVKQVTIDNVNYISFYYNTLIIPNINDFGRSIFVSISMLLDMETATFDIKATKINYALIPTEYICPIIQIWDKIKDPNNTTYTLDDAINETFIVPITIRYDEDGYDRIFIFSSIYNHISVIDGYFIDFDNSVRISTPEIFEYYNSDSITKQSIVGIINDPTNIPETLLSLTDSDTINSKIANIITFNDTFPGSSVINELSWKGIPFYMSYKLNYIDENITIVDDPKTLSLSNKVIV